MRRRPSSIDAQRLGELSGGVTIVTPVAPVADFSAGNTTPAAEELVYFTDLSTNSPTSWSWTFGGTVTYFEETSSTSQNPVVSWAEEGGPHTVLLTATNAAGFDEEEKLDYITVGPIPE
jgi:PKD repeat protein